MSKVASMSEAVGGLVADGDSVAIEGFTHLICHAAGHELIRQRRRNITLCRLTPDVIGDQLAAAEIGKVRKQFTPEQMATKLAEFTRERAPEKGQIKLFD